LFEAAGFFYKKQFFHHSAFYLLILGIPGTVASSLAGNAAGEGMEEGPLDKAMELYEQTATISLWLTIGTAVLYAGIYFFKYIIIVG
jgi:uncharacterized membrane protein